MLGHFWAPLRLRCFLLKVLGPLRPFRFAPLLLLLPFLPLPVLPLHFRPFLSNFLHLFLIFHSFVSLLSRSSVWSSSDLSKAGVSILKENRTRIQLTSWFAGDPNQALPRRPLGVGVEVVPHTCLWVEMVDLVPH